MSGIFDTDFNAKDVFAQRIEEDKQTQKEQAEEKRAGKNLTPAQKRDAFFALVADAINNENFSDVAIILDNHPKITFDTGEPTEVFKALVQNFNAQCADLLRQRKLPFHLHYVFNSLLEQDNDELMMYAFEISKKNESSGWRNHGMNNLEGFYKNCFGGFMSTPKKPLSQKQRKHLSECRKKVREYFKDSEYLTAAHQQVAREMIEHYSKNISQEDLQEIQSFSDIDWKNAVSEYIRYSGYHFTPAQDAKHIVALMNFYDDVPVFRNGWDDYWSEQKTQQQSFLDFVEMYFENNTLFEHTRFYKTICKHSNQRNLAYTKSCKGPEHNPHLCLSVKEMMLKDGHDAFYFSLHLEDTAPFKSIPENPRVSFMHHLIGNAERSALTILKNDEGKQLYSSILKNDISVLSDWCKKADQSMISFVVKNCPDLTTWSDQQGNHLGHYLVSLRHEQSKAFVQLLAKTHHEWFQQDNNHNVSLQDIFEANGATKAAQALIEKETMKRSMRDAGISMRSKPTQKKRM